MIGSFTDQSSAPDGSADGSKVYFLKFKAGLPLPKAAKSK